MNATANKTLQQLQAEASAAAEALRKAEAEAARKAREAKDTADRAKRLDLFKQEYARHLEILSAIVRAAGVHSDVLKVIEPKDGPDSEHLPRLECAVRGCCVELKDEYSTGSRFHAKPTGRLYVMVGDYGDRKRYPQLKMGGFNYEKIAADIAARKTKQEAQAAAEAEKKAALNENSALVAALNKTFKTDLVEAAHGFHTGNGSTRRWHHYAAPVGKVYLNLGHPCVTESQARLLLEAMTKAGLLK